jgi:uncharacterized cupredoxin-like copper-binding protein
LKTRLIVFFLTATQCILFVGCASRNAPQRGEQQNPFPSEQPFSNPTRTDTERNGDNNRDNRDGDNNRDNRDRDNNRDNRDRDNNQGGEYRRQKKHGAQGWRSHRMNVTTSETAFRLSESDIPAGDIDFIVTNAGRDSHEMSVIKTNFSINQLPVTQNGLLDQQKAGEKVGELGAKELKGGATKVLSLNLTPGKYLIISHLPGQSQGGMKAIFTVK